VRSYLRISATLVAALFISTVRVVAQTGEFASPVPGAVVHAGYALQDDLQNARNAAHTKQPVDIPQKPRSRHTESHEAVKLDPNK